PPPSSPLLPYTTLFRSAFASAPFAAGVSSGFCTLYLTIFRSIFIAILCFPVIYPSGANSSLRLQCNTHLPQATPAPRSSSKRTRSEEHTSELQSRENLV